MNKAKKVRLVFVDHTPFAGGAQLVLAEHIAEIDSSKFVVTVICSDTVPALIDRYRNAGASVVVMTFPTLRRKSLGVLADFGRSVLHLRRLLKEIDADLVVSNTTRASYLVSLATLGTRIKSMWWVRDFLYPGLLFRLLKPIPERIICVSQSIKQAYMSEDDPKGVVVYVANSLYKRLAEVTKSDLDQVRKEWGVESDDVVVGFMGRLVAEKGAEDLVEAVMQLSEAYPKVKLLIVGTGKNQMNDVEQRLKDMVKNNEMQDVVVFAGYQQNEALYYSLFDIFVLATRDREPFATSVVQAMMAKCAVIGTNAGGTPELVEHRQNGLLYDPGNVNELAECIESLLGDADLRRKLSSAGNERVLQYHREETVTDQLESLYWQSLDWS